uniref:Uncharacterized protein n=1 Tax=Bracon brevicornis TaxID=1563983 RepID=A0A6V7LGT1_9HYME
MSLLKGRKPWRKFQPINAVLQFRKWNIKISHVLLTVGSLPGCFICIRGLPIHQLTLRATAVGVEVWNASYDAFRIHEEGEQPQDIYQADGHSFLTRNTKITLRNGEELRIIIEEGTDQVIKTNLDILLEGAFEYHTITRTYEPALLVATDPELMSEVYQFYKKFAENCRCERDADQIQLSLRKAQIFRTSGTKKKNKKQKTKKKLFFLTSHWEVILPEVCLPCRGGEAYAFMQPKDRQKK